MCDGAGILGIRLPVEETCGLCGYWLVWSCGPSSPACWPCLRASRSGWPMLTTVVPTRTPSGHLLPCERLEWSGLWAPGADRSNQPPTRAGTGAALSRSGACRCKSAEVTYAHFGKSSIVPREVRPAVPGSRPEGDGRDVSTEPDRGPSPSTTVVKARTSGIGCLHQEVVLLRRQRPRCVRCRRILLQPR